MLGTLVESHICCHYLNGHRLKRTNKLYERERKKRAPTYCVAVINNGSPQEDEHERNNINHLAAKINRPLQFINLWADGLPTTMLYLIWTNSHPENCNALHSCTLAYIKTYKLSSTCFNLNQCSKQRFRSHIISKCTAKA